MTRVEAAAVRALAPIHLIHVGGIGVSALARLLLADGTAASGSDPKPTPQTAALAALGMRVAIPAEPHAIPADATIVVSSAIKRDNPELREAHASGRPILHRAQLLTLLANTGRPTIAVSGTHGKTTTSAMITHILASTGADPTFVVGSELAGSGVNAGRGTGAWSVVEADESDGSLCWLSPDVAVLTNLEPEHLDHYAGIDELTETMRAWIANVRPGGIVIACSDDPGARHVLEQLPATLPIRTYGTDAGDARIVVLAGTVTVHVDGEVHRLELPVPGIHNARNATAAILACAHAGIPVADAVAALASFAGTRRRFERRGIAAGITVIDDYAHHPSEIAATLSAARSLLPERGRILAIFEPHLYSRTRHLGAALGAALVAGADLVAILPIEGSREAPVEGVTSRIVLDGALAADPRATVADCPTREDAIAWVRAHARAGDLLLTLGAGGITTLGPELLAALDADATPGAAR